MQSPRRTLDACAAAIVARRRGTYLRFGDGDVNLLEGKRELLQPADWALMREMREAFDLRGDGILKALPLHSPRFGLWPGMRPGVHAASDAWAEDLLGRCFPYFIGQDIYTTHALSYAAVFDLHAAVPFLRQLRRSTTLFVGNEDTPPQIAEALFGSAPHVRTPAENSYSDVGRIEHDTLSVLDDRRVHSVVVVAMGCSGRVLAKRLLNSNHNIFVFDFGSLLDALCGWDTRTWIQEVEFDATTLLSLL